MSKIVLITILSIMLTSCTTHFLISTNFHQSLRRGMTKEQFNTAWAQPSNKALRGNIQVSSRMFEVGGDQWEVLIYNLYEVASVKLGYPMIDHKEYVAFRNGRLKEWGVGTLPIALR